MQSGADIDERQRPRWRALSHLPKLPRWAGAGNFSIHVRSWPGRLHRAVLAALAERRLFLQVPFAIIAGCLLYVRLPGEPLLWASLVMTASLAGACALVAWRGAFSAPLLLATAAAFGFALLPLHGAMFGTPFLTGSAYGTYQARVAAILSQAADGQRVVLDRIEPIDGRPLPVRRARLFVRKGPLLSVGDRISGTMRFAQVPAPAVPGGYDAQFQAYFDGIGSYASATHPPEIVVPAVSGVFSLEALRRTIGAHIDTALDQPERGIARAIVIGDQSQIDEQTRATMAAAGLAHILAISGLHLTLVAGATFAAIRLALALLPGAGRRVPGKPVAAIFGIFVAFAYLSISGASVSAIRATIMLTLVFGAVIFGRQALTMRNVAIAAIIVLILDPAGLFRPSFQLSFAAVAALVGVYEARRDVRDSDPGWLGAAWRFVVGIAATSMIAGLATAVFAAYHFQQAAPLGVLGNVAALPIAGFVVLPMGLLSVITIPFGLDAWTFAAMGWGISAILAIAAPIADASRGLVTAPVLTSGALLIATFAIGWFSFFKTRLRYLGPVIAVPMIAIFCMVRPPDILIADQTLGLAIRTGDGLAMETGRATSFAVKIWAETYGEPIAQESDAVACDGLGCIAITATGQSVAAIRNAAAFAEDCSAATLVVARIPPPSWCARATQVIGPEDLARGGTLALRWNGPRGQFDVEPSITDPGRPWRVQPR